MVKEIWSEIGSYGRDNHHSGNVGIYRIGFVKISANIHTIWRERNARRHGEQPQPVSCIVKFVDKTIGLELLLVKGQGGISILKMDLSLGLEQD
ncbi:hypothetical protein YC2023_122823 [Brassica napus]